MIFRDYKNKNTIEICEASLRGEIFHKVMDCPDRKRFTSENRFVFLNSYSNIKYFTEAFPEAKWEGEAEKLKQNYLKAKQKEEKLIQLKKKDITDSSFSFRTKPFKHQLKGFEISKDLEAYALFFEQGCGKTKVVLDNSQYLFEKNKIDCLVVIAPNGVHRNWINEEAPIHLGCESKSFIWNSKNFTKKKQELLRELIDSKDKILKIFAFNIECFTSEKARLFLLEILRNNRALVCIDESHKIKNPSAKRTKFLIACSGKMDYRRILTGTPIGNGAHDVFSQFKFLDPNIIGLSSFFAFKNRYCIMGGFERRQIIGYRNIEELQNKIKTHSIRVLRSECLDLPERMWQKSFFDLSPDQLKLYKEVKEEGLILFNEIKGQEERNLMLIENAMAKVTKMRQISSGYIYDTKTKECIDIVPFEKNPRLLRLKELSDQIKGKIIIWTVFTRDIELILKLFKGEAVRYDGKTSSDDREKNKIAFQKDPKIRFFVANIAVGAEGLTLNSAENAIYYNNDYSLLKRSQSEARNYRIGTKNTVVYHDLIGNGTVDKKIIRCLRNKEEVAAMILQDPKSFFMEE